MVNSYKLLYRYIEFLAERLDNSVCFVLIHVSCKNPIYLHTFFSYVFKSCIKAPGDNQINSLNNA